MVVGSLRISVRLHAVHSLKEKRRPRRMLVDRLRNNFHVAVAEVDDQDTWNVLTLGVATVGNDPRLVEAVLRKVADFVDEWTDGQVIDEVLEVERR